MVRKLPVLCVYLGLIAVVTGVAAGWYCYGTKGEETVLPVVHADESDVVLDQEQRQYIWEIEHHVLVLAKHWFRELGEAWAHSNAAAIKEMMAAEFRGHLLQEPDREELNTGFAQVTRLKDSGKPFRDVDGDGFAKYLLGLRSMFSAAPRVKVFAKTLVPDARDKLDGPWQGVGVARLWGETAPGKPGEVVLQFHFRIPRPEQASQPAWLRQARVLQSQTSIAQKHFLRDVTRARGINPDIFHDNWKQERKISGGGGIYACDFNRDGLVDLLILDVGSIHLYQGQKGGTFKDVTAEMGLPGLPPPGFEASYAAFADLDGDGWEDLIMFGQFYRNEEGRFFRDHTQRCNVKLNPEATGIVVADYDRDGKVDLYVTQPGVGKRESWLDGKSGREGGDQLWRNLGGWKFEDVTARSNTAGSNRSVFSAVWLDANDDGWPDLCVPNEFGHGVLLVNQRDGTFREHTFGKLPGDFGTMGITAGDVNNDGKIDLYLANMYSKTGARIIGNLKPDTYAPDIMAKMRRFVSGSQLYINRGDLTFEPVSQAWQLNDVGWAYGPALIDLDNDGFLDVFATSGYMSFDRSEPDG
jgi:hypothetical protein